MIYFKMMAIPRIVRIYKDFWSGIQLLKIIIKKGWQCKPGRERFPAPQHQPIDRKYRKGKMVEDYSRDRAA